MMRNVIVMAAVLAGSSGVWAAGTPEQKCEGGKNETAGKLAACLGKAEKKLVTGGDPVKYGEAVTKCTTKFDTKWAKLEQAAIDDATTCPSTADQAAVQGDVSNFSGCLADKLGGDSVGNCFRAFPASGQTTAYGTGSDGDLEGGATLSYVDNGDGTITDNNTGLMWEKKDDSGGIHDKDTGYTWSGPSYGGTNIMDGTMTTAFLAALNAGAGFANHTDWRIPNAKELQSIVDYEVPFPGPTVNAAFHQAATCTGCMNVTAATCSCTASDVYWSSTTYRGNPFYAWLVLFGSGDVFAGTKDGGYRVRAVRGGL